MRRRISISIVLSLAIMVFDASIQTQTAPSMNGLKEPRLVITKSKRALDVFDGDEHVRSIRISLGSDPKRDKEVEGDGRTPEGEFYIFTKNPKSRFHLSIGVSYPSEEDAIRGLNAGLISRSEYDEIVAATAAKRMPPQKTKLGGEIYIHGGGTSSDWTEGCVALNNKEMSELFDAIPIGTRVTIVP